MTGAGPIRSARHFRRHSPLTRMRCAPPRSLRPNSRSPAPPTASSTRTPTANGTTSSPTAATGRKPKFPIRLVSLLMASRTSGFKSWGWANHSLATTLDMANSNPIMDKHDQARRRRALATQPLYRAVW
ncbi:hypothetical protein BQ8794_10034 [Mesorhizobium prunaredense]|uniref:Uncharacterized protein n=1 Tax=Mesorhizobium prunaredense TaxID=1631249 RepID=A0A1R3V0B1_9HYPH|nr:hypothetical protein BQ8794_10034 [Mesorhizobium prunaredense]